MRSVLKPLFQKVSLPLLADYQKGKSVSAIAQKHGITWKEAESQLRKQIEENGGSVSLQKKQITEWGPENDKLECTTAWSFPKRGKWATHDNTYRGNWAPQIPRNLILRYTKEGDTVLDQMVGGGTTLIEAKLLGRRSIGVDVNRHAVSITKQRLEFPWKNGFEPTLCLGDARNLTFVPDNSIDLVATHPPYAGIIQYSEAIEGDISKLTLDQFYSSMREVAKECYRVLKSDKHCAILIGDTRKKKHVVPIGFEVMKAFLEAGFVLKEIIIKQQHNMTATGFWYTKSIESNFLLLAHEYLFVFRKPV